MCRERTVERTLKLSFVVGLTSVTDGAGNRTHGGVMVLSFVWSLPAKSVDGATGTFATSDGRIAKEAFPLCGVRLAL